MEPIVLVEVIGILTGLGCGLIIGFLYARVQIKKLMFLGKAYERVLAQNDGLNAHLNEALYENNRLQAELERSQSGDPSPLWHHGDPFDK